MKKFIIKTFSFSVIIILLFLWVCSNANGYTDPLYVKFTTPKQKSLILGTSRAAQGLQPKVFDSILEGEFSNYAFTILHSPFGKTYLNSIKRKLKSNLQNETFIIAVDPWGLVTLGKRPKDSVSFRELNLALGNTKFVSVNPNPFYLLNNWESRYYNLIINNKSKYFLHKDGWLEVNVNLDSLDLVKKIESKEKMYREKMMANAEFSTTRLNYLNKTINYLKNYGKVYLVRLPIHPKIMSIENELMPDFNQDIYEAILLSNGYLDLTIKNADFQYTDGNHLHKKSGEIVSGIIANWIQNRDSFKSKINP